MLLLYPKNAGIGFESVAEFTFHYASTLSVCHRGAAGKIIQIYIPLCFYFIASGIDVVNADKHLHSTMLLLYPFPVGDERK